MILYIGQYRGGNDGWSEASKNYLKALQATNLDVVSRPIFMNNQRAPDGQVWETEKPITQIPKIIIQNVIPDHFEYLPGYNIGITSIETKRLNNNIWIYKMNLLDELWVNSESEKQTLRDSGVTIKISVIPMPIDTDYLNGNIDNINTMDIPELKGQYIFYFIGEHNDRSNLHNLIRAFNLEFTSLDNAHLLIYTYISGIHPQQTHATILEEIKQIKQIMRIHGNAAAYPREILITQPLTLEQMISLHKTGNCFVLPSYGESISIPALYAAYLQNPVICTDGTHTASLLSGFCDKVNSTEVPVITDKPPLPHIYTANERWMQPDILALGKAMRRWYQSNEEHSLISPPMRNPRLAFLDRFSYQSVANKIKENLSWAL